MKKWPIAVPLLALAAMPAAAAEPSRTYLASIAVPLSAGDRIDRFEIDTWGVDFLAVCRIPHGWRIKAGGSAAPDGRIEGEATHGITYIGRTAELQGLALVRLYGPVQKHDIRTGPGGRIPATFAGRLGLYRASGRSQEIKLGYSNVRLTPATRCPAWAP
jgi:hypothetical protein